MIPRHPVELSFVRASLVFAVLCFTCMSFAPVANADALVSGKASDGLVYVVSKDGDIDLWRARISDKAVQRVTNTPKREERRPAWSETARRVLLLTRNLVGAMKSNVAVLDPDSGEIKTVGPEPDFVQLFPVWSPNGRFIAHTFLMPNVASNTTSNSGVAIINLADDSREIVSRVEDNEHRMMQLDYSNNGSFIVASGRLPDVEANDKLWLIRRGTKPMTINQIPNGIYTQPQFTRDDQHVIFTYQPRPARNRDIMSIALAPGSRAVRIASDQRFDNHSATPSPTRDEIAFVSNRDGSNDIFLAPIESGPAVNLTKQSMAADTSPVWSPDGERIAYVAMPALLFEADGDQLGNSTIRVIDRSGKLLFETAGSMPEWMPPWSGNQPFAPGADKPTVEKES